MQGKVSSERTAIATVYVGIDVCKEWLDIHLHPLGRSFRVANDTAGLRRLKRELDALGQMPRSALHIVMEATGKWHRAVQRSLHADGFYVSVVDPLRARLFAKACGFLAKTDRLDARLLAIMGEALKPAQTPPQDQALEALQELVNARSAANGERTALSNRMKTAVTAFLRKELTRRLAALDTHIARLDAEIQRSIGAEPEMRRRLDILISIPGIGAVTAASLIAGLCELGACSGKQAAMLAGLAPLACESGERAGHRAIRGGRPAPRNAIYMAALSASRHNPDLAHFAERLKKAGKPNKVVLVAVMRKLIVLANTLITKNRIWTPNPP
ncbi:IS110 family transposase [Rhizobium leguminosarum]|uniref:Transposase n=4 Tax=Rhizobium TaxID=379 RepID=A0A1B1CA38_RHILE|nr:IS110 family transposase [Rhizobium leguminosarum]ANP86546.1 transposase [Rhizobium leguminosarum]ANP88217.1 transposase [Rhizobium leguminosarum]ANP90984.1 transposase [Rhizobium leguminosarum]